MLYRGSRDGYGANSFHQLCDGHQHTITLVKTLGKNRRFGGYSNVDWGSSKGFHRSESSFLFSFDLKACYLINHKKANAVYCDKNYGPVFGKYDICIESMGNYTDASTTALGNCYYPF